MAPTELAVSRLEKEFAVQLESLQKWFKDALEELRAAENSDPSSTEVEGSPARQPPTKSDVGQAASGAALAELAEESSPAANGSDEAGAAQATLDVSVAVQVANSRSQANSRAQRAAKRAPRMRQAWQEDSEHAHGQPRQTGRPQRVNRVGEAISRAMARHDEHKESCDCSFPLHPQSTPRMVWDVLAAAALLIDFVTIPLNAFGPPGTFLKSLALVVLVYWTLDMFMQCITSYFRSDGKVVTSYGLIVKRYAMTWLLPDAVIVALEWLTVLEASLSSSRSAVASYRGLAKSFRALRLVRLLRLLRLAKLREIICKLQETIDSEWVSILWGICCNITIILLLNHICACLWFFVGQRSAEAGSESWVVVYDVQSATFTVKYLTALHWSLTQFTPASMTVQPQNPQERLFAVSILLVAMITFTTFVSSVTAGMTRLRNLQAEHDKDVFRLRKFLHANRITPNLSARVFRYVDIVLKTRKKMLPKSSVKLLQLLSGPLNVELLVEMFWPHLGKHPYFVACLNSHTFGHLCCIAIDMQSVSTGDKIFNRAGVATRFYLLRSGSTVYRVNSTKCFNSREIMIPQGSWFSEAALWAHWYHQGSMYALTECSMVLVDVIKFAEVVHSHMQVAEETRVYARDFVQAMAESIGRYGRAWDLPDDLITFLGARKSRLGLRFARSTSIIGADSPADTNLTSLDWAHLTRDASAIEGTQEMSEAEVFELRLLPSESSGSEEPSEAPEAESNSPKEQNEIEGSGSDPAGEVRVAL